MFLVSKTAQRRGHFLCQKGKKIKVIFWKSIFFLLYLKHILPIIYDSLQEMVLNIFKRHISSYISMNLPSKKVPKLSEPYLRNHLMYRAMILHVKFFNVMYKHIQKWRKSKMVNSQLFWKLGDFVWNDSYRFSL